MLQLARAIVAVAWDVLRLVVSFLRSSHALRAENLFLRKQLASYIERGIKPRRVDHATRVSLALFTRLFDWRDTVVNVRRQPSSIGTGWAGGSSGAGSAGRADHRFLLNYVA